MKTKRYAMLAFVLLTSVLTMCLARRAMPKTQKLEREDKTDAPFKTSKWYRDMWQWYHSGNELSKNEVMVLLVLYSEKTTEQRDTLKGLHGVEVVVELLRPEAEKYSLTREALQTDVELRLRQHGIRVNPGGPCLYINVNTLVDEQFGCAAVSVLVQLRQQAVLFFNPKTNCNVPTWERSSVGLFGLSKLRTVRETVQDFVDVFINDYLAANPKQRPVEEPKEPIDFTPIEENDKTPKDD